MSIKNLTITFLCLMSITFTSVLPAEEACTNSDISSPGHIEKLDRKISKLFSKKKKKLKKIKEQLTSEKLAELKDSIHDSAMTEIQKLGLIEMLEDAKAELENVIGKDAAE